MIEPLYDDPVKVDSNKERTTRIILDRYESRRRNVDRRRDKWDNWYASYRSWMKTDPDSPFRSQLFVPMTFSHIESHLPRIASARPKLEVWGREPGDALRAAAQRALINSHWDRVRMDLKLVDYTKAAFIYGIAFWKVGWRRSKRMRLKRVPNLVPVLQPSLEDPYASVMVADPQNPTRLEEVEVIDYDGPTVDLMDPGDVFPSDGAWDEDSSSVILRHKTTWQELKDQIKPDGSPLYDGEAMRKLEERLKDSNILWERREDRPSRTLVDSANDTLAEVDPFKREFHLLEEWFPDKVRTIVEEAPDLDPIRNESNPYGMVPGCKFTPIPLPNEWYGISFVEALFSIQSTSNYLTNGMLDHLFQTVHAMHTVRRGSGIQQSQIKYRGGGTIQVVEHDDIRPMATIPLDFTHYREVDFLRNLAQEVSGSTDIYRGIGSTGDTATESSILAQAAASRIGLVFQILSAQPLHRLGKLWIRMNELYLDRPQTIRVLGEQFLNDEIDQQMGIQVDPSGGFSRIQVTPEMLALGSDEELDLLIDVAQTEPATRQFKLQRSQMMLQTLGPRVPPGSPIDDEIMEQALSGLGNDHPERTVAKQKAWMQQMMQAQAQAEQQPDPTGGGAAGELAVEASADAPRGDEF